MSQANSHNGYVKVESHSRLDHDLQNCIEEFDRIIYQVPSEFSQISDFNQAVNTSDGLTSDFDFSTVHETEHGWVEVSEFWRNFPIFPCIISIFGDEFSRSNLARLSHVVEMIDFDLLFILSSFSYSTIFHQINENEINLTIRPRQHDQLFGEPSHATITIEVSYRFELIFLFYWFRASAEHDEGW